MPTPTYELIASTTLAASTSEVVFGSLPQTYRDLILVSHTAHNGGAGGNQRMRLNGDTGSNYPFVQMFGDGTGSGTSNSGTLDYFTPFINSNPGLSQYVMGMTQLMDYSATDKHTTILLTNSSQATSQSPMVGRAAARWANTAAVTTILIYSVSTNIEAGSTFNLYGIAS